MSKYLVFDTNALPVKGNFGSAFWVALFHLCITTGVKPAISEVTFDEAVNLRREMATAAITDLLAVHGRLSSLTSLAPAYLPTADGVAREYEQDLQSRFEVLPLDGAHAVEAFKREARRQLPARNGIGGRDSAIWLTLVGLARAGHEVNFVTNNSKDFGRQVLHDSLQEDLVGCDGEIRYHAQPNDFLSSIASKVKPPEIDAAVLSAVLGGALRGQLVGLLDDDVTGELTVDRAFRSVVAIDEVRVGHAYLVDGQGLVWVSGQVAFLDEGCSGAWATGLFSAWLDFDADSREVSVSDDGDSEIEFEGKLVPGSLQVVA